MRKPPYEAGTVRDFVEEDLAMLGYSCEPFEISGL
jgi:hypothetical protein